MQPMLLRKDVISNTVGGHDSIEPKIRKDFPEIWIYEDINDSGLVDVAFLIIWFLYDRKHSTSS